MCVRVCLCVLVCLCVCVDGWVGGVDQRRQAWGRASWVELGGGNCGGWEPPLARAAGARAAGGACNRWVPPRSTGCCIRPRRWRPWPRPPPAAARRAPGGRAPSATCGRSGRGHAAKARAWQVAAASARPRACVPRCSLEEQLLGAGPRLSLQRRLECCAPRAWSALLLRHAAPRPRHNRQGLARLTRVTTSDGIIKDARRPLSSWLLPSCAVGAADRGAAVGTAAGTTSLAGVAND